jgi:hypothetical protein
LGKVAFPTGTNFLYGGLYDVTSEFDRVPFTDYTMVLQFMALLALLTLFYMA